MTDAFSHSVLVVEDEPLIRINAVDMVEDEGFTVFEASNADAALRILESNPTITVLFTDIDMPGSIDGLKLAHLARQRWPDIAIVIVSGQHSPDLDELPENGRFVAKPYFQSAMIKTIRETISQTGNA
jgi:CheY-like chemotaxis protein